MGTKWNLTFCFLVFGSKLLLGQTEFIEIGIKDLEEPCKKEDRIYTEAKFKSDFIEVRICNVLKDTLYLFDSYLNKEFALSKYLHRVDKKNEQLKISFLPILPFLGVKRPDVIILGENRLIKQSQILYHFTMILPNQTLQLKIDASILEVNDFVKDINLQEVNRYERIKFKNIKNDPGNLTTTFEFALYEKVNLLIDDESFYLDEFNFTKQSTKYIKLEIPLEK
jgi:hypothetical protein